jgi:hypothetical protein
MHLVLTKNSMDGNSEVIGTHWLEWRRVLCTGSTVVAVELMGYGGAKVPVGVVELQLELFPKTVNGQRTPLLSEKHLSIQVRDVPLHS